MTKSRSQQLSEKAAAELRRCCNWLIPFMQNGLPKFLTKDDLRVARDAPTQCLEKLIRLREDRRYRENGPLRLVRTLAPTKVHQNLALLLSNNTRP
jgi:hypothetical protein